MASYTVNFTDGSSHTYDNVPETVTEDQVRARASDEYGDKEISHVAGDVASSAAPAAPAGPAMPDNQPNLAEKGVAAAQTAFNTLKPVAHYAMSHPIETAAVGSYVPGVNQLPGFRDVATARKALYDRYIGQSQTLNALKSAPTPPPEVPPVGGAPAQQGASFIQNITQKFAPMAARVAPVLEGASKMIAPAMIAKELYYTSPEDRAALQQMQQTHTTLKDWTKKQLGIQ